MADVGGPIPSAWVRPLQQLIHDTRIFFFDNELPNVDAAMDRTPIKLHVIIEKLERLASKRFSPDELIAAANAAKNSREAALCRQEAAKAKGAQGLLARWLALHDFVSEIELEEPTRPSGFTIIES